MRIQHNHAHADCRYTAISWQDYLALLENVAETRLRSSLSLNVHLPFEVQHPYAYKNVKRGLRFIQFGETLKHIFHIHLYWENAPAQNYGRWDLKYGQTHWSHVPPTIDLCLDTGHIILGAHSASEARKRIVDILNSRGNQIKHLHIHENDLRHDIHRPIGLIITSQLFATLIHNRTYILEKN